MKLTICLIEDDRRINNAAKKILKLNGYEVITISRMIDFTERLVHSKADVIVIDSDFTKDHLDEVIKEACTIVSKEFLLLLGREQRDNIPCITKPINYSKFLVSITEITRDCWSEKHGPFTFLVRENEVIYNNQTIKLTNKEFQILKIIASAKDYATRKDILNGIWGVGSAYETRTVDMHIKSLRRKLPDPNIIETRYGKGYCCRRPINLSKLK